MTITGAASVRARKTRTRQQTGTRIRPIRQRTNGGGSAGEGHGKKSGIRERDIEQKSHEGGQSCVIAAEGGERVLGN